MRKPVTFMFAAVLLSASLLAACGATTAPTAAPGAAQGAPAAAAVGTVVPAIPPAAAVATAIPKTAAAKAVSAKVDACTLLTKDDVSKVLGQAVDSATGKGLGGVCTYVAKNVTFELTVLNSGGAQYVQTIRSRLGQDALDFPGVGDSALYNPNSYMLAMSKGDAAYLFFVVDSTQTLTDTDRAAKEKALAVQLLSHL